MRKNKIILSFILFLVCIFTLNTVCATEIFDSKSTSEIYKLSDDNSNFNLPFFRISNGRMELDKEISQLGMFFTNSSVDVNSQIKGSQFIFSNDSVRINSDMENVIIFCATNVIIDANVRNIIVFAGSTITIEEKGNVSENIIACTPQMVVNGNVDGNILGSMSSLEINSVVNGEVRVEVDNVKFGEKALLESGININTENQNLIVPESVGTSNIDIIAKEENEFSIKNYVIALILAVITDLVTFALILIIFKKDKLQKMSEKINSSNVIKNGILTYLVSLACIIFGFTLSLYLLPKVGGAALTFGVAIIIIFTLIKNIVVGTFIAQLTSEKYKNLAVKPNIVLTAITSFLMIELFETIPVLGEIIKFLVFIFAIGIVSTLFSTKKTEKVENETEVIEAK